jgi:hypothetical protein
MTEEEMNLIEMLCKPLTEILAKHPYHSITIDAEHIEVNNTMIRVPVINERLRKAFGLTGKEGDEG